MDHQIQNHIKRNWGKKTITEIQSHVEIDLYSLLTIAYQLECHKVKTANIPRRWTQDEDQFLIDHADCLTITEGCNLLYRSRYATYQRVKYLQLDQMINK